MSKLLLTSSYPLYERPRAGEQRSYARFAITFVDASSISWAEVRAWPVVGVSGEVDFGNIDSFGPGDDVIYGRRVGAS